MDLNAVCRKLLLLVTGTLFCFGLYQGGIPADTQAAEDLYVKIYKKCNKDYKRAKKKCGKKKGAEEYDCYRKENAKFSDCIEPDNIKNKMYLKINKKTLKAIEKAQKKCHKISGKQYAKCSKLKTEDDRENCNELVMNNTRQCANAINQKYRSKLKEVQ